MSLTSASLSPFAPDPSRQETWMRHLDAVHLAVGEALFRQGDPAEALYFVETGELAVILEVAGAGRVPVRRFGPGQCIGEMALYRREPRTATIEALVPTHLWRLSAAELARIEQESPALAMAMHRHVANLLAERVSYSNTELKEPLARLAHAIRGLAASRFGESDWDRAAVCAAAKRPDEVGATASALEFLVGRLHAYIGELKTATAEREAIESELRIAGRIQASFLPPPLPASVAAKIEFSALSRPALEAGGDLYDGFFIDERRFFFVVGDVSGKGVSAALFMAVTAMCLRALAPATATTGELLTRVNRLLCERNETMQFVTVLAGILDTETGELGWSNCGHPSPAVIGPDGLRARLPQGRGTPIAVFEDQVYTTQFRTLAPDETLLVYTDGVSEAMNPAQALYGEPRLDRVLDVPGRSAPAECIERLLADVLVFADGAPQADDITIIALRRPV